MASDTIQLKVALDQSQKDFTKLQKEGAFNSPSGEKNFTKIQGMLSRLSKVDLSKLDDKSMTSFLNELAKLRHHLDNAANGLTNYSKDFLKQQKIVEKANLELSKAQDSQREALGEQAKALEKYKKALAGSNYEFSDKSTGNKIPNRNYNQIADLYAKGKLGIKSNNTNLQGKPYDNATKGLSLAELKAANSKVDTATIQVNSAKLELSNAQNTLTNTPTGAALSPIAEEVHGNSVQINQDISNFKDLRNTTQADANMATANSIQDVNQSLNKQSSALGKAFKQFSVYAIAVRSARRALNSAIKTITDLDKYLTEQAMVTGKTRKQTYELLGSYQELATQLGATTKEVAGVATQYMRQGKSTSDALQLTEAAVSAAKVAGISATESVNYLTTALNGFQLAAEDAMSVSDKFAAIAAQSASSYEELAIALSKVASQANLAGMSIDYTTALLAKGLETTREAPETIGTALKTVIARMRELGDYGETLDDSMDVNNVETQLQYVGIALKNSNGELRSTEEVLDDLGKKWNTLSVNQQAAVAKALAGTRQQSRLIAMMSDYERVTELQEISERSAGATMVQMETYLQGMDAALKRLSVAWENIVTTIVNNEAIIGLIEKITNALNFVADKLSDTTTMYMTLAAIGTVVLINLTKKWELQKATNRAILQESLEKTKQNIRDKQQSILKKQNIILANNQLIIEKKKTKAVWEQCKAEAVKEKNALGAQQADAAIKKEEADIAALSAENARLTAQNAVDSAELNVLEAQRATTSLQLLQNSAGVLSIFGNLLGILTPLLSIFTIITTLQATNVKNKQKENLLTADQIAKEKLLAAVKGKGMVASIISSAKTIPGVIAMTGLALGLVAALGLGITSSIKASAPDEEKTQKEINNLSASIYRLEKTIASIETIKTKFDELDRKIIKTNEDIKQMNELLSSASDEMSTTTAVADVANELGWDEKKVRKKAKKASKKKNVKSKKKKKALEAVNADAELHGLTEQAYYNSLTDKGKREYLDKKEEKAREQAKADRQKQLALIKKEANGGSVNKWQAELGGITNSLIYETVDERLKTATTQAEKDALQAAEKLAVTLTDEMSGDEQLKYIDNPSVIAILVDKLKKSSGLKDVNGNTLSIAAALTSDDANFVDKVKAYKLAIQELSQEEVDALKQVYPEFDGLAKLSDESNGKILEYMDNVGITSEKVNDLKEALHDMDQDDKFVGMLSSLYKYTDAETGVVDLQKVIDENFKDLTKGTDEYNQVLNMLEKTIGDSILNIGQAMIKTQNQINNVYETAQKWSTMNAEEQSKFLSENSKLFQDNVDLYEAFKTGNYQAIESALRGSQALQEDVQNKIRKINSQLAIEEARSEDQRNEFLIQYLKDQLTALENENEFYKASLEIQLEQEQKQLDIYKDYLQKQQDEQTKALEKRKDAYSAYFDAIKQEQEDTEYEAQALMLTSNLSKLASSDNADSKQKTKELEQQLQDLEKERLDTLRERAQEAVLKNLDDQVSEINDKFDKLLASNQNLLGAMLNDEQDKSNFMANMISSSIAGKTGLEAQSWLQRDFMTAFGSFMPSSALSEVSQSISEVLNLNVNGGNVQISERQQAELYTIIMNALKQIGYR